jgi:hypothetical protein
MQKLQLKKEQSFDVEAKLCERSVGVVVSETMAIFLKRDRLHLARHFLFTQKPQIFRKKTK